MEENYSRVNVKPTPIVAGEKVKVNYNGLLSNSGADNLYLHAGVGFGDNWRDVTDIKMKQSDEDNWSAELRINTTERFNFCFKDAANNWDNNDGHNWNFEVHNGEQYS